MEAPDSGTHSAAGWALRQWQIPSPMLPKDTTAPVNRTWMVTDHGFTMFRIRAGVFERFDEHAENNFDVNEKIMALARRNLYLQPRTVNIPKHKFSQTVELTSDFWLSDCEINISLFKQFIDDGDYPAGLKPENWIGPNNRVSPTPWHPVQNISWEHAVMFCNWLSKIDGLTPYYEFTPAKPSSSGLLEELVLQPGNNGYRLPTEAESEYGCRASSTTHFCYGHDTRYLVDYAVHFSVQTEVPGGRMCNRVGLFDMHGNVWEWCYDWFGPYNHGDHARDPHGPPTGDERVTIGGGWYSSPFGCLSGSRMAWSAMSEMSIVRFSDHANLTDSNLGFRVARSMPIYKSME